MEQLCKVEKVQNTTKVQFKLAAVDQRAPNNVFCTMNLTSPMNETKFSIKGDFKEEWLKTVQSNKLQVITR